MRFVVFLLKSLTVVAVLCAMGYLLFGARLRPFLHIDGEKTVARKPGSDATSAIAVLDLTRDQAASVKVQSLGEMNFKQEIEAVGNIDFNENLTVQVFPPYQGRVLDATLNVGDRIEKGQVLFTIDSPDLLAAESTLIAASGVLVLQTHTLDRLKTLIRIGGVSQQNVDQTTSDQMTAEGALKSARDAVRIFGKTDADIDNIILTRRADPRLVVTSPVSGFVTARTAQPGLFVQPGAAPAPFTVADMSIMWMLADVVESDGPLVHVGQEVTAHVAAYPDRDFVGRISVVSPAVDPSSRRVFVRSDIRDPEHLLQSGMLTNFSIRIAKPVRSVAAPERAVVREGDGSMAVWVTTDNRRFTRRLVQIGKDQDGFFQILGGVRPGELVVTENASFLSNQFNGGAPAD